MRTKLAAILVAVFGTGALVSYAAAGNRPKPVQFEKNAAMMTGVKLSAADQEQFDNILRHFDQRLYKIGIVDTGRPRVIGRLRDVWLTKAAHEAMDFVHTNPQVHGMSYQIGTDVNQQSPPPQMLQMQSEELVRRVTPILRKYQAVPSR